MVVTSYEVVIADAKHLQRHDWKYLVVDEGHRLKNSGCRLLRELRTIPSANKLLLTGPPLSAHRHAPAWMCMQMKDTMNCVYSMRLKPCSG